MGISIEDIVNGNISSDQLAEYGISSSLLDGIKSSDTVENIIENADIPVSYTHLQLIRRFSLRELVLLMYLRSWDVWTISL